MSQAPTYRVFRFTFPYPPRLNLAVRVFRGIARPAPVAVLYKRLVRDMVRHRLSAPLAGPLLVSADVFRPRRSGDVDGHMKVLLDALQRDEREGWPGLYLNDSQMVALEVRHWDTSPRDPRVQLTVIEDTTPREAPAAWRLRPGEAEQMARARAELEALAAKERTQRKAREKKREALAPPAPLEVTINDPDGAFLGSVSDATATRPTPPYRVPLPAGSSPGRESYGARHGLKDLRKLARPASYPSRPKR